MNALQQRIIEAMPEILEIIGNENRGPGIGGDSDFRPYVVRCIERIAELETVPPFRVRRGLDSVAQDAKRLELSLRKLPLSIQPKIGVDKNLLASLGGLASAPASGPKAKEGKAGAKRKRLAAEAACDLLLDFGGEPVTLTRPGPYIKLSALLYKTATGSKGSLDNACVRHFKSLGLFTRGDRSPRRRSISRN